MVAGFIQSKFSWGVLRRAFIYSSFCSLSRGNGMIFFRIGGIHICECGKASGTNVMNNRLIQNSQASYLYKTQVFYPELLAILRLTYFIRPYFSFSVPFNQQTTTNNHTGGILEKFVRRSLSLSRTFHFSKLSVTIDKVFAHFSLTTETALAFISTNHNMPAGTFYPYPVL